MVVHLWGKFFMAAWRGNRALTWVTGALAFVGSIGTAFTGYLSQTNFDSQWTAGQAKDGLNSIGVGYAIQCARHRQMLLWHVMLLPLVLGVLVVAARRCWCAGTGWCRRSTRCRPASRRRAASTAAALELTALEPAAVAGCAR